MPSPATATPSPAGRLIPASLGGISRNKGNYFIFVQRADANAGDPVDVVERVGLGVDRVDHVVVRNEDPADAAVAVAGFQVVAVQVENLQAMVAAVRDPKAILRVDLQCVGRTKFAMSRPELPPTA